jgi:leucyl aminopeptidase (aminopeptidase T)
VVYEGSFHSEIVSQLKSRLKSAEYFNLEEEASQTLLDVGRAQVANERAGFLEFAIRYPASLYDGHCPGADGLEAFISWPETRMKLCFDVTDNNFCELFSESPQELAERCVRLRDQVAQHDQLQYHGAADEPLTIRCAGAEWVAYAGFGKTFDHVLPSGEVACLPASVDGKLEVVGWIVGTIPFGVKFGRIQSGELELRFKDRQIVSVGGANQKLCSDFEGALASSPRLQRVSESGIGQSLAVRRAAEHHRLGYSWHERHFGLHLGLGAELPREDASNSHKVGGHHLDIVLCKGRLTGSNNQELLNW